MQHLRLEVLRTQRGLLMIPLIDRPLLPYRARRHLQPSRDETRRSRNQTRCFCWTVVACRLLIRPIKRLIVPHRQMPKQEQEKRCINLENAIIRLLLPFRSEAAFIHSFIRVHLSSPLCCSTPLHGSATETIRSEGVAIAVMQKKPAR